MDWPTFWTGISALGAVASAIVAYVAARIFQSNLEIAKNLLKESRELRLANEDAEVIVYIEPSQFQFKFLNLVMENVGPGVAFDVMARCKNIGSVPEQSPLRQSLDGVFFIQNRIPLLAPGQRLTTFIYSAVGSLASDDGIKPLTFEIRYRDRNNRSHSKIISVDLRIIEGSRRIGSQSPIHDIERHLKKSLASH